MKTQTYLSDFKVILPENKFNQSELIPWISHCHTKAEKCLKTSEYSEKDLLALGKLFDRYAVKETQIKTRYLETKDGFSGDLSQAEVYSVSANTPQGSDIQKRTQFFSQRADSIFRKTYDSDPTKPDHLIHVTCTGYISPSPAQKVVTTSSWGKSTGITHAYHMGCYAALPSIRIAQGLVAQNSPTQNNYKVDIFHTEMCGLHLNTLNHTPEQIIVQTLFADGHIKYSASDKPAFNQKSLKILAIHEKVVPNSVEDMSWLPTSWGMEMNLSRDVPQKIKGELTAFIVELLKGTSYESSDVQRMEFAVHPGGPKIIDAVRETLDLSEEKVFHSKKILFERGNMSSATLPHVWESMLQDSNIQKKQVILSLAFGPGLTIFGSLMEVHK